MQQRRNRSTRTPRATSSAPRPHTGAGERAARRDHPLRVALTLPLATGYARNIARGVADYANAHGPWEFLLYPRLRQGDGFRFRGIDGIISAPDAALVSARRRPPTVVVGTTRKIPGVPVVMSDPHAMAGLVVDHFRAAGLVHMATILTPGSAITELRAHAFEAAARASGASVRLLQVRWPHDPAPDWLHARLRRLLGTLPRPLGLYCWNDDMGRHAAAACRDAGLRVPEDVAIVGVDNDDLICSLTSPPISSVDHGAREIGYEAARILDAMMKGLPAPHDQLVIPPRRLVVRASSDTLAASDPALRDALRFIRENVDRPLGVWEVAAHFHRGRRSLELQFRKHFGRSVHDEIVRSRLERAKALLAETERPLPWVARACGFRHLSHFSATFKARVGTPPSEFRKRSSHPDPH